MSIPKKKYVCLYLHAFGMAHPIIWKFLEGLKLTIKGNDTDYEQFIAGNPRPAKRTKYVDLDNKI